MQGSVCPGKETPDTGCTSSAEKGGSSIMRGKRGGEGGKERGGEGGREGRKEERKKGGREGKREKERGGKEGKREGGKREGAVGL